MKRLAATLFVLVWAVSLARGDVATTPLTFPSGDVFEVELMQTAEQRAMGLMFRPSLAEKRGLLFLFGRLDFHGIWMKNCRFPIDILWLDEQQRVVHTAEKVPPCRKDPCPSYEPMQRAAYVVEVNAGVVGQQKVALGNRLAFTLPSR